MKPKWIIALIGMGSITIILIAISGAFIIGGGINVKRVSDSSLGVFVQVEPFNDLGKTAEMHLMLENLGDNFIQVDEIWLPAMLSDAAVIYDVFPSLYPGRHDFLDGWERYPIGLILGSGERREFTIEFMPWQIADIANQIKVQAGGQEFQASFRIVFNKPIAAISTSTEIPTPTATFTPIPIPTEVPAQAALTAQPIPFQAVVKITAKIKYSSYLRDIWSGSGTIVSEDGFILTNAHLVLPVPGAKPDVFVVSMTLDPSSEPIELYYAEPVLTDEDLDLAVIRITSDIAFNPVDWLITKLPTVPLGDSDQLQFGEELLILGYPGIGGETITLTNGNVGGFTAQQKYGDRAFIKTSASISGGTSGGTALNSAGYFVAVPTQLGSGEKEDLVDCRVITDTNGDNKINQFDACIPVGGFINALRPINLALPLIESARTILLPLE